MVLSHLNLCQIVIYKFTIFKKFNHEMFLLQLTADFTNTCSNYIQIEFTKGGLRVHHELVREKSIKFRNG